MHTTQDSLTNPNPHNPQSPPEPHLHLSTKLAFTLLLTTLAAAAQTPAPRPPTNDQKPTTNNQEPTTDTQAPSTPHGEVLFESHGTPPPTPDDASARTLTTLDATPAIPDAVRSAILFTAYDLDARLTPSTAGLVMRARLTLRNTSAAPLPLLALQISSSLKWESVSLNGAPLPLVQHLIDTDADHTGKVSEAVLTLSQPLAPGASLTLDTLYSGAIPQDATRLERIGATPAQALDTDWDSIGAPIPANSSSAAAAAADLPAVQTALRGFGNVLWYPVSTSAVFLGDGARLFQTVAARRLADAAVTIHLRLAVEYTGEAPIAAYFCGRRQKLTALPDNPDAPIASGTGIATANFAAEPIGFRLPSLFLVDHPETLAAPLPEPQSSSLSSSDPAAAPDAAPTGPPMLAVETTDDSRLPQLALTAQTIAPLLQKWFGPSPLSALTLLDHPGEPFADGPLLVAPLASLAAVSSTSALVHSLTHAWVQTGQPWFDEGLSQFLGLLWTEQQQGRAIALAQLADLLQPVALAEPAIQAPAEINPATSTIGPLVPTTSNQQPIPGEPLISTASDLFYRRKAASVWWMLHNITGDQPLADALTEFRTQPASHESSLAQAQSFERLLEKSSQQDLAWFFNDWILRDRGLPDLTITDVTPRQLPAGKGHDTGWLVAVTVRNDGAAAAEVPVIIRSGTYSTTKRLRIPGFSIATDRVLLEAPPSEVQVNDGSTPELRSSTHTQSITLKTQ